jgi:predicted nucleotidyltransferase
VKPLLYVFRVLLTGIHLMRTGDVEANLLHLNREFRLPFIDALIGQKTSGERVTLADAEVAIYQREFERLLDELEAAAGQSQLPEKPSARAALNELLIRLRSRSV